MTKTITQKELKDLLFYDLETGLFFWRINRRFTARAGTQAGHSHKRTGYSHIRIYGVSYFAHRLAWLYVYGCFPETEIDHIDRNKTNNKINNLRDVSHSKNMTNRGILKSNKSGHPGVSWDSQCSKWRSTIRFNKKQYHVGYFEGVPEAILARKTFSENMTF